MSEVVSLPLIMEEPKSGRKLYVFSSQKAERTTAAVAALDMACPKCLMFPECMPAREVFDNGRAMRFIATKTDTGFCGLDKNERGSIMLKLEENTQSPPTYRSVLSALLGRSRRI